MSALIPGDASGLSVAQRSTASPRCLRLFLRADLAEVETVRKLVDDIQDLCALSEERIFDIKVALSEACANAIEHASSATNVVAWLLEDRLLFEITNDGGFLPGLQKDTDNRRRGLGLPLMASLADQLHISRLETGVTRVSLTFWLLPGVIVRASEPAEYVPRLRANSGSGSEMAEVDGASPRQAIFAVLESVAAASTLRDAALALLEGARGFAGCEGGMLRLREDAATSVAWLPALLHCGLREEFLQEEALIRTDECMCGRVCLRLTDPGLPFFTPRGSFHWGRAQTIADQFGAETLGEVRGRCIAEGFESVAIFPLIGEKGPIGVLHLVDHEAEKFDAIASTLEWACRVAGRMMSRGDKRERAAAVRQAVRRLQPSPVRRATGPGSAGG